MRKIASGVGWLVIAILVVAWLASSSDTTSQTDAIDDSFAATVGYPEEEQFVDEADEVVEEPPWDPPAGFGLWADSATPVAWRWVENPKCDYGTCWQVEVVSRDGCPNGVYVSLNELDADETVVDYTNDSLSSLEPDQIGRLTLADVSDVRVTGRITEINCY